jgi:hypothetical protein
VLRLIAPDNQTFYRNIHRAVTMTATATVRSSPLDPAVPVPHATRRARPARLLTRDRLRRLVLTVSDHCADARAANAPIHAGTTIIRIAVVAISRSYREATLVGRS